MKHFSLTVSDRVARLRMTNGPVNAITRAWADGFHACLDELERRDDWGVLCIGSDEKAFCAGADLKLLAGRFGKEDAGRQLADDARFYQQLFDRIENLPRISIAEIAGAAVGGGYELALACDLRIASESAKIGLPEVGIGLLPGAGGTQRLTRLCGRGIAARIIIGSELVTGKEARQLGMVEWAVPAEELASRTMDLAIRLADMSIAAVERAKACIRAALDPAADGFAIEIESLGALMAASDTQGRISSFLGQRS